MAKTNVLYIDGSKFTTILSELGIATTTQSGFIRVDGPKGRRVYVAATKKVGRVDISGFTVEFGAKTPHCGEFGNVKQQLDLDPALGEDGILTNFKALVEHMLTLPAVEKAPPKPKAPKAAKVEAVVGEVPAAPAPDAGIKDRLAAIKAYAESRGMAVSNKTLALAEES